MCIEVIGSKSKKLLGYIERVSDYLDLSLTKPAFMLTFKKNCSSNAGGYCNGDQDFIEIEIAREDTQGKIPLEDLMINIAHELVHAKQIAEGRLRNLGFVLKENTLVYCWEWEDKEYSAIAYKDQPWEIEAYSLENKIFQACR
jgi:hypothetical protein